MVGLRGVRVGRARDGEEDCDEEEHAPAEHLVGGEIWAERSDREHARVSVPTAERARATSYGVGIRQKRAAVLRRGPCGMRYLIVNGRSFAINQHNVLVKITKSLSKIHRKLCNN